jgi:hypothetical protein
MAIRPTVLEDLKSVTPELKCNSNGRFIILYSWMTKVKYCRMECFAFDVTDKKKRGKVHSTVGFLYDLS